MSDKHPGEIIALAIDLHRLKSIREQISFRLSGLPEAEFELSQAILESIREALAATDNQAIANDVISLIGCERAIGKIEKEMRP